MRVLARFLALVTTCMVLPAGALAATRVSITPAGVVTASGHRGQITMGHTTEPAVKTFWGAKPEVMSGHGNGDILSYGCEPSGLCPTDFVFAPGGIVDQFSSTGHGFSLTVFGHAVHAGMSADAALHTLKAPDYVNCQAVGSWVLAAGPGVWVLLDTKSVKGNAVKGRTHTNHSSGGVLSGAFTIAARNLTRGFNPHAAACGNA